MTRAGRAARRAAPAPATTARRPGRPRARGRAAIAALLAAATVAASAPGAGAAGRGVGWDLSLLSFCLGEVRALDDAAAALLGRGFDAAPDGAEGDAAASLAVTRAAHRGREGEPLAQRLADESVHAAQGLSTRAGRNGFGAVLLGHADRPGFVLVLRGRSVSGPISCDLLYAARSDAEDLALALELFPEPAGPLPGVSVARIAIGAYPGEPEATRRAVSVRLARRGPLILHGHSAALPGHVAVERWAP